MIIVLKPEATESDAKTILAQIESVGLKPLYMPGTERIVLGALGDERVLDGLNIPADPMVEMVKPILSTYKQVSREMQSHDSQVNFGGVTIGGGSFAVIAGPCAVENKEQIFKSAALVKKHGAVGLRGGAFKPRTSPYSFQGLEEEGLKLMQQASKEYQIPCVSEIIDASHVDMMGQYVDAFQVGARNMQNFKLLKAVGQTKKPTILKRGMSATIEELLLAAEYIYNEGNPNVIICERGIRTYEKATRNTLDLNAVALSGELNQGQRNQIMESCAKGQHKILVTTDLASRGLDLVNVSHVINFDMPKHTEEFVHRIGRTGRAGTKGDAISLIGPNDWLSFKNVEAFLQQKISFTKVDGIKVKFKGLKPKKANVVKAKSEAKKVKKVADHKPRKVIKKTFLDIQDAGAMKIIKRKKPLTPEQIEDSNKKEQD